MTARAPIDPSRDPSRDTPLDTPTRPNPSHASPSTLALIASVEAARASVRSIRVTTRVRSLGDDAQPVLDAVYAQCDVLEAQLDSVLAVASAAAHMNGAIASAVAELRANMKARAQPRGGLPAVFGASHFDEGNSNDGSSEESAALGRLDVIGG